MWEKDWNDGVLSFKTGSVVAEGPDGSNCMKWSANGGWSNTSYTMSGMEQNTDYLVRFKMKTSAAAKLFITMQAYSDGEYGNETFKTTSEWADYEMVINTKTYVNSEGKMRFKFQDTGVAQDVWVDDLYIAKVIKPEVEEDDNLVNNGDFELGNLNGWNKHQQTTVTADAAKSGSYGAYLNGNSASWGGVLDQNVNVENGKTYTFSFDYKAIRQGFNFKVTGVQSGTQYAGGYVSTASWTHFEKEFTVVGDTQLLINYNCGGQTGTDEMYVDNISLKEE
jgi:hypothetical protein